MKIYDSTIHKFLFANTNILQLPMRVWWLRAATDRNKFILPLYELSCTQRFLQCTQNSCTHVIDVHWSKNISKNALLPGCIQNTDKNQPSVSYVSHRYI